MKKENDELRHRLVDVADLFGMHMVYAFGKGRQSAYKDFVRDYNEMSEHSSEYEQNFLQLCDCVKEYFSNMVPSSETGLPVADRLLLIAWLAISDYLKVSSHYESEFEKIFCDMLNPINDRPGIDESVHSTSPFYSDFDLDKIRDDLVDSVVAGKNLENLLKESGIKVSCCKPKK